MPKKKGPRPKDINLLAARLVMEATGQVELDDDGKDPNAVALGRKGGLKGGKARAASLSKKKRSDIAKRAAAARWKGTP